MKLFTNLGFMKNVFPFCLLVLIAIFFYSCNKEEGEGGTASVEGRVFVVQHPDDNFGLETDTMAAAKTDVFIVYGESDYFNDDVETDAQGFYRFKYLNKGEYTVFAYSTLSTGEKIAVSQTITIKRGENGVMPDLFIHEGKAYGTSIIKGTVKANYIDGNGDEIQTNAWAYEHRVYIRKIGEPYHFDDVRVGIDGIYMFQKILPGNYEVFTTSVSQDGYEIPYIISQNVTVSEAGQIVEVPEFTVFIKP